MKRIPIRMRFVQNYEKTERQYRAGYPFSALFRGQADGIELEEEAALAEKRFFSLAGKISGILGSGKDKNDIACEVGKVILPAKQEEKSRRFHLVYLDNSLGCYLGIKVTYFRYCQKVYRRRLEEVGLNEGR